MPSTETFWSQMGAYNEATLPVQIIMIIVAVVLTYIVFARASARANTLMKLFLAFAFTWNGIVFFLISSSYVPVQLSFATLIVVL